MEEFLLKWGAAIGIFIITGVLMEALNKTIGAEAGDKGFRGVWYVWRRVFIVVVGAALGIGGAVAGLSSPIGDGVIYGGIDGVVAAWSASGTYDLVLGSLRARVRHKLAKNGSGGDDKK